LVILKGWTAQTLSRISGVPTSQMQALISDQVIYSSSVRYRCCPQCLAEDDVPYLRSLWSWRMQHLLLCPRHRTLISFQCAVCRSPWTWKLFGASDRPVSSDLLWCSNPQCRAHVMRSNAGTLAEDHGAVWLQQALLNAEETAFLTLPSGQQVERHLLRQVVDHLPDRSSSTTLLPFDVTAGLHRPDLSQHTAVSYGPKPPPWLLFSQRLLLSPWLREEELTGIAEALATNSLYRKSPEARHPSNPVFFFRDVLPLLFFSLVYQPGLQVIDRETMSSHDFSVLLRTYQRTLGLNAEAILNCLPEILSKLWK